MACEYNNKKYDNRELAEEAVKKQAEKQKITVLYDSDSPSTIVGNLLNQASKNVDFSTNDAVSVTQAVQINNTTKNKNQLTPNQVLAGIFQKELGSKIHKALEIVFKINIDPTKDIDFINVVNDIKSLLNNFNYSKLSEEDKKIISEEIFNEFKENNYFLKTLFQNNKQDDPIMSSLIDIKRSIVKGKIGSWYPEFKMQTQNVSIDFAKRYKEKTGKDVSKLNAIIDLIYKNSTTGNLIIYDYKTVSSTSSLDFNVSKYADQVALYKKMLEEIGIYNDIEMRIIGIKPGTDGKFISFETKVISIDQIAKSNTFANYVVGGVNVDIIKSKEMIESSNDCIKEVLNHQKFNIHTYDTLLQSYVNSNINRTTKHSKSLKVIQIKYDEDNNPISVILSGNDYQTEMPISEFINKELAALMNERAVIVNEHIKMLKKLRTNSSSIIGASDSQTNNLYRNFYKYAIGNWENINHPALEQHGIIVMRNTIDGSYDFINLIQTFNNDGLDLQYKLSKGDTVLGDLVDTNTLEENGFDLPKATLGDIFRFKTMLLVHKFSSTFNKDIKIGDIKILDLRTGLQSTPRNLNKFNDSVKVAYNIAKEKGDTNLVFNPNIIVASEISQLTDFVCNMAKQLNISIDRSLIGKDYTTQIKELNKVRTEIERAYSKDLQKNRASGDIISDYDRLHRFVGQLMILLNNVSSQDVSNTPTYGLSAGNLIGTFITPLVHGTARKNLKNGQLVTGLAQGLDMSVSYANPNKTIKKVQELFDIQFSNLRRAFNKYAFEVNQASEKFVKSQKGILSQVFGGNNNNLYSQLFEKDKATGKLSRNMQLLNPYTSMDLTAEQKEYLEVILWSFNRFRMKELNPNEREMTYKEFSKSNRFQEYKNNISKNSIYLQYPLRKSRNFSQIKARFSSFEQTKETFNNFTDHLQMMADPSQIGWGNTDKQLKLEQSLTMFNQYDVTQSERERSLETHDVNEFEMNINLISLDYAFQNLREVLFNKALKQIDCIIGMIRLAEETTGKDYSDLVTAINERVKISLYNKHILDEDLKDPYSLIFTAKQINSVLKIGFRPILFAKEMSVSTLRLMTAAKSKYFLNEGITATEMTKAFGIVFGARASTLGKKISQEMGLADFDLIGQLNNDYGIANRDVNTIADRTVYNRFGFHNALQRAPYVTSQAPDFYNRMAIFVAKMIHDGCFEAHSVVDGQLVYDMSKDKRFDEFWEHRNDPNYTSENFIKQKSLYLFMANEFSKEGKNIRIGQFDENNNPIYDQLPYAYVNKEKASLKEAIGDLLGYYDHEEQATSMHKSYFLFFTQFLTYWTGSAKHWMSSGNYESARGKIKQLTDKDGNLLYIEGYTENGEEILTTKSKSKEGKNYAEALGFMGHPVEGLFISVAKTLHDLYKGNLLKKMKSNDPLDQQQVANSKLFLMYILILVFLGKLIKWIFSGFTSDEKDIPDELTPVYKMFDEKVTSEFSFINSILSPIEQQQIAGVDDMYTIQQQIFKVMGDGDNELSDLINKNILAIKDFDIEAISKEVKK